jgi:hypothetical protein
MNNFIRFFTMSRCEMEIEIKVVKLLNEIKIMEQI